MSALTGALQNLLWVALIFAPLERAWGPRRPLLRPGWRTDLAFYFGQTLAFLPVATALIFAVTEPVATLAPLGPLRAAFAGLPAPLQLVLVVMLGDLLAYWGHRAQHAWGPLWRFHAVHHTAREVDWLAAYREHPLDGLYTQALINLPAIVLDLDLNPWLGLIAFRGGWAILLHSRARIPLGPLKWIFGSPEFHRAHHDLDRHVGHYANLAPYLDLLFGTHGPTDEPDATGIREPHPEGWLALCLWPFRRRAPATDSSRDTPPTPC